MGWAHRRLLADGCEETGTPFGDPRGSLWPRTALQKLLPKGRSPTRLCPPYPSDPSQGDAAPLGPSPSLHGSPPTQGWPWETPGLRSRNAGRSGGPAAPLPAGARRGGAGRAVLKAAGRAGGTAGPWFRGAPCGLSAPPQPPGAPPVPCPGPPRRRPPVGVGVPGPRVPVPVPGRCLLRRPPWILGTPGRRSAARAAPSCCGGCWCWGCAPWSRWWSTTGRWVPGRLRGGAGRGMPEPTRGSPWGF